MGNSAEGETEVIANQTIWHAVKLLDLLPGTVYYYQIKTAGAESDVFKFKTPPVDGSNEGHVRFGLLGDSRTVPTMYRQVIDAMKKKMIEQFGEDIENHYNVVINVGDIISSGGNLEQYQKEYFAPITPLSPTIPFMVSIGNHEGEDPYYYQYMKYEDFGGAEGEKYYSFRLGRVLFIALNSNGQFRRDTQINWLNNVLQSAQSDDNIDWVFAYCHHPGHSEVWPDGNTSYIQNRVIPTMSKYSKAAFLMYGHSHDYERGALTDVPLRLMLSGGGGAGLDRWRMYGNQRNYTEIQKSYDHYCYSLFDIDLAKKSYVVQTYSLGTPDKRLNNVKIDSFYRKLENVTSPEKPMILAAQDSIDLPFILQAGRYVGNEPILSSHFQVTETSGDYSDPLVDDKRDFENIYYDTGSPDYLPIDKNADIDLSKLVLDSALLQLPGKYFWRVRYRDRNLQWSDWSDEGTFILRSTGYHPLLVHNKSLQFDGEASYVEMADNLEQALLPKREMTVEAWVKLNNSVTWGGYIGAFQDNGDYEKGWVLGNYGQAFSLGLASGGTDDGNGKMTYLTAAQELALNKWYHVAATYDGATMHIYVNGQLSSSSAEQSGDILYDPSSYFDIGAYHDENEFNVLDGQLDEVRLWDIALNKEMIREWMHQEMNETHPQFDHLISYWNFNEITGNTLRDMTENNNGNIHDINVKDYTISTIPVGLYGAFDETKERTSVGPEGIQLSVEMISNPTDKNNLGIYQSGINDGTFVDYEEFPDSVNFRSQVFWGVQENGNCVADLEFQYKGLNAHAMHEDLRLLNRKDALSRWVDITDKAQHDLDNKIFRINDATDFGEYALGWKTKVTAVHDNEVLPVRTALYGNYPNPFNPTTKIRFDLRTNSVVTIRIFDITGREIRTLADGISMQSGHHEFTWDGLGNSGNIVASGLYLCSFATAKYNKTLKMMLIR